MDTRFKVSTDATWRLLEGTPKDQVRDPEFLNLQLRSTVLFFDSSTQDISFSSEFLLFLPPTHDLPPSLQNPVQISLPLTSLSCMHLPTRNPFHRKCPHPSCAAKGAGITHTIALVTNVPQSTVGTVSLKVAVVSSPLFMVNE